MIVYICGTVHVLNNHTLKHVILFTCCLLKYTSQHELSVNKVQIIKTVHKNTYMSIKQHIIDVITSQSLGVGM